MFSKLYDKTFEEVVYLQSGVSECIGVCRGKLKEAQSSGIWHVPIHSLAAATAWNIRSTASVLSEKQSS